MPPKRDAATANLTELRQKSRGDYLAKRSEQQLILLQKQVEEEDEERRTNPRLSKAELADFDRNRETLRLALSHKNIDEHLGGFLIPDADFSSKQELLSRKAQETYKSETALWDEEQEARARAQVRGSKARTQADDYDYVFDESSEIKFVGDATSQFDPKKVQLEQMIDAAETKARTIEQQRASLPIFRHKDALIQAVKENRFLIVCAETGSGKTTQIPSYLLESQLFQNSEGHTLIGCTQPRRVAAMSVAKRVADELGTRLGHRVGYSVRFDDKTNMGSDPTEIKYMTDGLLTREVRSDPLLSKYSVMVIDEAHERSLQTDLLMVILRDIARERDDFRVICASATLDASRFSKYFDDAPIYNIPGRSHPIEILYTPQPEANYLAAAITTVFQIHLSEQNDGDVLVFLTGEDEITAAQESIEETSRKLGSRAKELLCLPLYSQLAPDQQAKVFEPTPPGVRKVILSTNIAETSLTIDGIRYVVDSGYVKQNNYQPSTNVSSLDVAIISKASANQRAGRAGRTSSGRCFRLYPKWAYYNELPDSTVPEIMRTNLDGVILLLKSLGINDIIGFEFFDPPSADVIIKSLETLYSLAALSVTGELTKRGRSLAELPLDPKLGATIIAAEEYGCVSEILTIVALMSEGATLFHRPKDKAVHADSARLRLSDPSGDMLSFLKIYNEWVDNDYSVQWSQSNFLDQRTLNRSRDVRDQLQKMALETLSIEDSSSGTDHLPIQKALIAGFAMHACRLNRDGRSYTTLGQSSKIEVNIHPSSILAKKETKPKTILFYEIVRTSKDFARSCMEIDPLLLTEVAPHLHKAADVEKLGVNKKMPKGQGRVGVAA